MSNFDIDNVDISENEYLDIFFTSRFNNDNDTIAYNAEVLLKNFDDDDEKSIGCAFFNMFNLSFVDDPEDLIDTADSISGDDYFAMDAFINHFKDEFFIGRIVILNKFIINEEYRGKGIGTYAMDAFNYYWDLNDIDYQILIARPLSKELSNNRDEVEKLIAFYNKFEYKKIESVQTVLEPVLVRNNIFKH